MVVVTEHQYMLPHLLVVTNAEYSCSMCIISLEEYFALDDDLTPPAAEVSEVAIGAMMPWSTSRYMDNDKEYVVDERWI